MITKFSAGGVTGFPVIHPETRYRRKENHRLFSRGRSMRLRQCSEETTKLPYSRVLKYSCPLASLPTQPLRRGRIVTSCAGRASRVRTSNGPSVKVCFCPASSDVGDAVLSCFQGLLARNRRGDSGGSSNAGPRRLRCFGVGRSGCGA